MKLFISFIVLFSSLSFSYPSHWWKKIDDPNAPSWEILPHEADRSKNEVILSKRNELGIFSNFGHSPFILNRDKYASVEGFWQMMKYPEIKKTMDPRSKYDYPFNRDEVAMMHGFEAKEAGDLANIINKKHGFNWVSYKGVRFNYKDHDSGSKFHYKIIYKAIKEKVMQNKEVKALLLKTKGLKLLPDHHQKADVPKSYKYFEILMDIRENLLKKKNCKKLI